MEELKKLINDLGRAFEEFKTQNDSRIKAIESKGFAPADLTEKVERINKDISNIAAMKAQLEAIETAVARSQFAGGGGEPDKAKSEYRKAFLAYARSGDRVSDLKGLAINAAMTTQDDTEGGFLTTDPVKGAMREIQDTVSAMRGLATVVSIGSNEWKELVDMLGDTAEDATETSTRNETNTPGFKEISIVPKEISAKPKVTQTMLDDANFDIEAFIGRSAGRAINRKEGAWFISGDGVKQAMGLNSYPKIANSSYTWGKIGYVFSGHATLLNNADKLIALQHALKPYYRNGAKWLMNDSTVEAIRYFKNGNGDYIWRPGLQENAPDLLLGKPIAVDDNVDDIGAGKYPIYFGNFKEGYLIVDRFGIRVLRDPYSSKPYVEFYTTKRVGGGIVMYEAIKGMKIHTS